MQRTTFLCAAALAIVVSSSAATAQTPNEIAAAKQAFKEGEDAEKKGDYATALAKFEAALAIKETPQLHLRAGAAHEKLGKLVAAKASYERGLARANASSQKEVAKVAEELIAAISPRIPIVTVKGEERPGSTITIDGKQVWLNAGIPLDPGAHTLHAEAPGLAPQDLPFTLEERDKRSLALALAPEAGGSGSAQLVVPGAVITGVSGAALITGATLLALSYVKGGKLDDLCGGPTRPSCPADQRDHVTSEVTLINAFRASGAVLGGLGIAGVVTGAVLLARATKKPASASVIVVPSWTATSFGAFVVGSF